jgi:hypothetical protein
VVTIVIAPASLILAGVVLYAVIVTSWQQWRVNRRGAAAFRDELKRRRASKCQP